MRKVNSLIVVSMVSGCATLGNPEQKVIDALARQDFARAASIVEKVSPRHQQYALLQTQYESIVLASREFRQSLLQEAQALGQNQQWQQAFNRLNTHRRQVVDPSAIDELIATLSILEGRHLNQLLAQRRQDQARVMLENEDLAEQLALFHDSRARAEKERLDSEHARLVEDLTRLGEYFADQQQWSLARDLLRYAQRLQPEQPPSPTLAQAQRILNSAEQRARAKRNRALQDQAELLMARYQRSGQLDALLAARSFLEQHADNPTLADHHQRLEQWARRRFAEEINTGEALYARGQYKEAHRIWSQVAPLYPNNEELNKKLERSQRVLNNLRSLKDS